MPLPPMISYFHKPLMISLEVPDGWARARLPGSALELFGPEVNNYRTNLTITTHLMSTTAPESFEQLIRASYFSGNLENELDQLTVMESGEFLLDGYPAFQIRLHWVGHNDSGANLPLAQLDVLIRVDGETVYEIHAYALQALEESEIPVLEHMVGSIRIIPQRAKPPEEKPYQFEISPN
ncbi:MAG: hypothetical protein J0I20_23535 [Chloroflexi bacterium]|nr:hypothetical protein [Chloroflexota bacterium]OJW04161.1 MAG: hypothetical protein BGO39_06695 [Chloroflexi bacterium 54-19]